jgi:hypothetical protein
VRVVEAVRVHNGFVCNPLQETNYGTRTVVGILSGGIALRQTDQSPISPGVEGEGENSHVGIVGVGFVNEKSPGAV